MSPPILTVADVRKEFSTTRAVDGVSLEIRPGEIFALLGPNGAGKTTLTRMILGIIRPDSGRIAFHLAGRNTDRPDPAEIGYLPEDRGLYKDIPILRTLVYFGELRGLSRGDARRAADEWFDRLGLSARRNEKLDALSKGNQQKVQFAAAVIHRPRFAILDEPFSGFDPINQEAFLDLLRDLRRNGMTILLSAHQMQLVERIADRVLLMSRGREVLAGTLPDIRRRAAVDFRLTFEIEGPVELDGLADHPAVAGVECAADGRVDLLLRPGAAIGDVLTAAAARLRIRGVHTHHLTLHDIYVRALGPRATDADRQFESDAPGGAEPSAAPGAEP